MENHETPEVVQRRASQEDPIVMYLIVRQSINMSIGKTAAQCAHASQMLQMKYGKLHSELVNKRKYDSVKPTFEDPMVKLELIYEQWMNDSFRKVVLRADEKEWARLKEDIKTIDHVIVVDAGLTELEPGTETVIGLWPIKKSQVNKTVKRLQVLK